MKIKSKVISGMVAGCAALAVSAAPAAAAPVTGPATATTDAGTTCTVIADASVGQGLIAVKPVSFTGSIDCTLADPANPAISSGNLVLQNSLPLGLSVPNARPNDPQANERQAVVDGFAYRCELEPGVDCGFSGREDLGLLGQTYTALFGTGITAPEGETWVSVSGCTKESDTVVGCSSQDAVTVR